MKGLAAFMPSPRPAKRFINLSRPLRALLSRDEERKTRFLDPSTWEYRAPMLLLAIQTGHPDEAVEMLRALIEGDRRGTWQEFLQPFRHQPVLSPDSLGDPAGVAQRALADAA